MGRTLAAGTDYAHPHSLRVRRPEGEAVSPTNGDEFLKAHGQALDWALDRARIEQKAAAFRMGYTDPGVVSRWISGKERMQLDKLRLLGDDFFGELLVALAQTCSGVEVRTQVTLIARTA